MFSSEILYRSAGNHRTLEAWNVACAQIELQRAQAEELLEDALDDAEAPESPAKIMLLIIEGGVLQGKTCRLNRFMDSVPWISSESIFVFSKTRRQLDHGKVPSTVR